MRDFPETSDILEELGAKVEADIDRLAISSFRSSLKEMTDFHKFLLSAYVSEDTEKKVFSFSEIGDWGPLHGDWLKKYRNLFERAIAQISREEDTTKDFIHTLMYTIFGLLPSKNEQSSPKVTAALFDMHLSLIHKLEDWAVRNGLTEIDAENIRHGSLAKNLQRKYEDVVRGFIGASESLLPAILSSQKHKTDEERWELYRKDWLLLSQHLRNTAYFLVVAIWNEDKISAPYYCEALIKWLEPIKFKLEEDYTLRHELLTPDLLDNKWDKVLEQVQPYLKSPDLDGQPVPKKIFSIILQNTLKDIISIVSSVIFGWHIDSKNETDLASNVTGKLIRQTFQRGSSIDNYAFFICLIRMLVSGSRFRDEGYTGALDEFIRRFDGMSEKPQISGRIFTPSTRNRRDDLLLPWTVILLSALPTEHFDNEVEKLLEFLEHEEFFPDADSSIRDLVHDLETMKHILENTEKGTLVRSFSALSPDKNFDEVFDNFEKIFDTLLSGIKEQREERIRTRPIDPNRLAEIESASSSEAFSKKTSAFPIHLFDEIEFTNETLEPFSHRITNHSRGCLTNPIMSEPSANEKKRWAQTIRDGVSSIVLGDVLSAARKQEIKVATGQEYWDQVKRFISQRHGRYILIINSRADPVWLSDWVSPSRLRETEEKPDDLEIWHSEYHSKSEEGYEFHINRIAVYQAPIEGNHSFLVPEDVFEKVEFTTFSNGRNITAEVVDISDDPWSVLIKLSWARRITIGHNIVLELKYGNPIDQ